MRFRLTGYRRVWSLHNDEEITADAPQQLTVIEKIAPSETRTRFIILVQFVPFTRSQD